MVHPYSNIFVLRRLTDEVLNVVRNNTSNCKSALKVEIPISLDVCQYFGILTRFLCVNFPRNVV